MTATATKPEAAEPSPHTQHSDNAARTGRRMARLAAAGTDARAQTAVRMLSEIRAQHHDRLRQADIAVVWDLREEKQLAKLKILDELSIRLIGDDDAPDAALVISIQAWETADDAKRRYAIDAALCSMQPKLHAETGEQVEDTTGRRLWVAARPEVSLFVQAALRNPKSLEAPAYHFVRSVRQMALFEKEATPEPNARTRRAAAATAAEPAAS